jgi:hypothetical protein
MRRLSIAAIAGTLTLAGLAPNALAQPPAGIPPVTPPTAPPGCAIALAQLAQVPQAAPGMAAVAERCPG